MTPNTKAIIEAMQWMLRDVDLGQMHASQPGQLQHDQDHGDHQDRIDAERLERFGDERGLLQQERHKATDHDDNDDGNEDRDHGKAPR